jgi:16S rRNA (cytosine967-C5)-methyltransferase
VTASGGRGSGSGDSGGRSSGSDSGAGGARASGGRSSGARASGSGADAQGLPARRAALNALRAVDEDGAWSNLAVPEAIAELADERDRAFAAHLAYDTLRWAGTLDWALGQVLTRPLDDVEPALRRVLRLGALQLLRSGVPARAAVATSVALASEQVPRGRAKGASGFVNGVLRALSRQLDDLPWPDQDIDPVAHLALTTGHPPWIVEDLLARFDRDRVAAILAADDDPPGVTLRATGDRAALVEELRGLGVDASPGDVAESVRAPGADPRRLDAVAQGRAVPQDEASMRVVHATAVRPGARVLDLCAGPGGKATHLARLAGESGRVVAIELHPHRAELVRQAAARQGVAIDVRVGDAADVPLPEDETFDVVLLDAPCTGLGTGRRRPEVRWRRTPGDASELAELQAHLLARAAERVAPGGSLTYAVCTWTAAETDEVVDAVEPGLRAAGFEPTSRQQLLPDRDDTDGMYVATWVRTHGPQGGDS